MVANKELSISIVIPTFNRGRVLINTINSLLGLTVSAQELIIVDQTHKHDPEISEQLNSWHQGASIKWIHLEQPSVAAAMNVGLLNAHAQSVLFLDDDIEPFDDLIEKHQEMIRDYPSSLIAGRVVQPWDTADGVHLSTNDAFSFNSLENRKIDRFMGGNFCVDKSLAISVGGFDENFKGTAHNFEREFADRLIGAGYEIQYAPMAAIHHIKEQTGGIRTYGHFLKTIKPHHAVGAYYYIFRSQLVSNKIGDTLQRLFQRLATKTHIKEPWWIPITFIGDLLGILWALYLWMMGPKLISNNENVESS